MAVSASHIDWSVVMVTCQGDTCMLLLKMLCWRSVAHIETLALLCTTKPFLGKCDYLQPDLHSNTRMRKARQHNRGAGSLSAVFWQAEERIRKEKRSLDFTIHTSACVFDAWVLAYWRETSAVFFQSHKLSCTSFLWFFQCLSNRLVWHLCILLGLVVLTSKRTQKRKLNNWLILSGWTAPLPPSLFPSFHLIKLQASWVESGGKMLH